MELRQLNVVHWFGQHRPGREPGVPAHHDALVVDTCQRRVGILASREACEALRRQFPADGGLQLFEGHEAYAFLLRFACGLESRLVGETEIFGQIKQAWNDFTLEPSALAHELSPWMQRLFQDVKDIRARFLSSLGSASYGSQVRRLLGEPVAGGTTLLVGAGQLAESIAPWLDGGELQIWNRTTGRAIELANELIKRPGLRQISVLDGHDAELAAWGRARDVVVCIPADPERDPARIAAWNARADRGGRLIHLGLSDALTHAHWGTASDLLDLGTLFDLLRSHTEQRRRAVERARRGCAEKAMLRSLGPSTSAAHGWEDLAAFATLAG
ncbi:MAG: hypothetical protein IT480_00625 [Gammaproteobacteria bacterium]|nr:hypothetical protein [Gammaproteobacteria bacterium]